MKKITTSYKDEDTGEEQIIIDVSVDGLDEQQEDMVQEAIKELTRYILRMKGVISPECGGCSGC